MSRQSGATTHPGQVAKDGEQDINPEVLVARSLLLQQKERSTPGSDSAFLTLRCLPVAPCGCAGACASWLWCQPWIGSIPDSKGNVMGDQHFHYNREPMHMGVHSLLHGKLRHPP